MAISEYATVEAHAMNQNTIAIGRTTLECILAQQSLGNAAHRRRGTERAKEAPESDQKPM
jgi:hypothetical protein